MFNKKRGQVTIFIILGIIVIISIIVVLVLRNSEVKTSVSSKLPETQTFSSTVDDIERMITKCLSQTIEDGVFLLTNIERERYEPLMESYIRNHIFSCIDFSPYTAVEIDAGTRLESLDVTLANDRTFISADMTYPITITKGISKTKLNDFTATYALKNECCFRVKNTNCIASESGTFENGCGMTAEIKKGESLLTEGGICLAC